MRKVFVEVSDKEQLAKEMPQILSQGKSKVIYFDERFKDAVESSKISAGKYSISLDTKCSIGFYRTALIIEKSKRNEVAVYLGIHEKEIAVYVILAD